jgi:hypothetical protein
MRKIFPLLVIGLCCVAFYPRPAEALVMSTPKPKFAYKDASGKKQSVEIVDKYQPKKIVQPLAKIDSTIDPKLCRAATIAQERANAHSHSLCWRFVKEALVAAGVVRSRPTTLLAKQAGQELVNNYGFKSFRFLIRMKRRSARCWCMAPLTPRLDTWRFAPRTGS